MAKLLRIWFRVCAKKLGVSFSRLVADAHRDGKRFVVRANEKLTAFMELESAIRDGQRFAAVPC